MSDVYEDTCPLCMEVLDITDRSLQPCKCGYQMCLLCFHQLTQEENARCPNCRTVYALESLASQPDPELVEAAADERKKQKEQKERDKKTPKFPLMVDRSALQNVRVMQRNLVYVVGIAPSLAKEEILRRKEHFGKFGRIIKVALNRKQLHTTTTDLKSVSASAYVTFYKDKEAAAAISALDGTIFQGRTIRATFGTTKYCSFFLRSIPCTNPNCLYLHDFAQDADCYTKEDLQTNEKLKPTTDGEFDITDLEAKESESQRGGNGDTDPDSEDALEFQPNSVIVASNPRPTTSSSTPDFILSLPGLISLRQCITSIGSRNQQNHRQYLLFASGFQYAALLTHTQPHISTQSQMPSAAQLHRPPQTSFPSSTPTSQQSQPELSKLYYMLHQSQPQNQRPQQSSLYPQHPLQQWHQ